MAAQAAFSKNEMIKVCEQSMARQRAAFRKDTGGHNTCETCGGALIADYVPLCLSNDSGQQVWVHMGSCHHHFVATYRIKAERVAGFAA